VSVDVRNPYYADDIESVKTDFLTWQPPQGFDVGLCLQVLEHVRDAPGLARHLLGMCDVVIVSVPYRWPKSASSYHFHDPVDARKMRRWFGREPNYAYRVVELNGQERLICVYDNATEKKWNSVDEDRFRYRWILRGIDQVLAEEET
jgi:2-polyprenyl-3-methyl-5-hydroxy-6-metoxy-1,4-benzoquinol methylase